MLRVGSGGVHYRLDRLAVEEPLEIRVAAGEQPRQHPIAVTMRTPGADRQLAAGFLLGEGVIDGGAAILRLEEGRLGGDPRPANVVTAFLAPGVPFDSERFRRQVYVGSSCGICGRTTLERLRQACPGRPRGDYRLSPQVILSLPERLAAAQTVFARTGGLHAAALFTPEGELCELYEDVGRHNALDKLIGSRLLAGALPAAETVVLVSGRASYELVQKALMAGIPTLAAVGAPSSLAVDLARAYDLTLIGFLRDGRFNLYTAPQRVATATG
ncbi:MAG: formate dehydrogenase accessory sulfurtransferase FdhD [Acidobacteria bacterium]|nr:MAG: formate dehydrogenase accessory sulfurtransferase FdhD [Acidobacteriota bacterium]